MNSGGDVICRDSAVMNAVVVMSYSGCHVVYNGYDVVNYSRCDLLYRNILEILEIYLNYSRCYLLYRNILEIQLV